MSIPSYCSSRALQAAIHRLKNPPKHINYEHHVSTWPCTMLKKVFQSDDYTISSEVIDPNEGSKPDFLIERLNEKNELELVRHLYVELKKVGGDHFEKALDQVTKHIQKTIEEGHHTVKECFIVVQRGLDIGFFEYHARHEDLQEKDIPNFRSCVSLTQVFDTDEDMPFTEGDLEIMGYHNPMKKIHLSLHQHVEFNKEYQRIILPAQVSGLKELSFGKYKGNNQDLRKIHEEAKSYSVPCVFNIEKHQEFIDYLFYYMSVQTPRQIVTDP
jgi:hypothetical protein